MALFNTALIGCGFMGRMHSNVYQALPSARLVGVHDKSADAAKEIAEAHSAKVVDSYSAILEDPAIDVIDICLPTDLHAEFAIAALNAGKQVVCEKPMALTLAEADQMLAAANSTGKTLMIAHCIRMWPEYVILKRTVADGSLGKLLSVNLTRYGAFPTWSSNSWLADEKRSGGGALDMHIHDTDFALDLLGEPDSLSSWGTADERGVSQIFTTATWGKTVGHLQGGWNLPSTAPFRMAFRAIFERGLAIFDDGSLTIYEDGKDPVVPKVPKMSAAGAGGNISDLGGYYFELEYFYKCLSENLPPSLVSPESSRESLRVALEEIRQVKSRA